MRARSRQLLAGLLALTCAAVTAAQDKKPSRVECRLEFVVRATEATRAMTLTAVVPGDWTGRQKLLEERFDPPPKEIVVENDTRYAVFELAAPLEGRKVTITSTLELRAPGLGVPKAKQDPPDGAADPRWLAAEKHIEADDPKILAAAKALKGKKPLDLARNAADQVIDTLRFSGFDPASKGAAAALQAKAGDCTEFTDLTVALLRARQVPTRHVMGFYTAWTDTPKHSWLEAHVKGSGWTMLDPTRGQSERAELTGPHANYVWLTTVRNDERLAGFHYFRHVFTGGEANVFGTVFLRQDERPMRSAPL